MKYDIVALHGYGFDHDIWDLLRLRMEGFRWYAPDLPGFDSEERGALFSRSMDGLADFLYKYLEDLKSNAYVLLGHSMGGFACLHLLKDRIPRGCKALVLLHSHCFADSEAKRLDRLRKAAFIEQHGSEKFLDLFYPGVFANQRVASEFLELFLSYKKNMKLSMLSAYMKAMADRPDYSGIFSQLELPVLIYHGKRDSLISYETIRQMMDLNRKAICHIDEVSGHMSMLENPDELSRILNTFVKRLF